MVFFRFTISNVHPLFVTLAPIQGSRVYNLISVPYSVEGKWYKFYELHTMVRLFIRVQSYIISIINVL